MDHIQQIVRIRKEPYRWNFAAHRRSRNMVLLGIADTQFRNVIAVRGWSLGFQWPVLRHVDCLTWREYQ